MDKNLVEEFAKSIDKQKVQEFYQTALNIISSCLAELKSTKNSAVLDEETIRIFPMGDYTNDTFIDQTGELEIVIASSNPQIAMANKTFVKNLQQTKSKKQKEQISKEGSYAQIVFDFANALATKFDKSTTILLVNDGIKVFCLKEYGFKILIRFATFSPLDENAILWFWDPISNSEHAVDLFTYNEEMEKKDAESGGNYKKLVRIFKNVRKTILSIKWTAASDLNKYFIELIVFNVPNLLVKDENIFSAFAKSVNYLTNCNIMAFKSFDGRAISTFSLAKISFYKIKNFVNYLSKLCAEL